VVHARPLSGLDATFLHLETARTPMHMGSVAVFEGGPLRDAGGRIRIERLRADVEERLDLVPKLRQRVRRPFLGQVAPVWVDDEDFDVAAHMRVVALPKPGTTAQLARLSAEILAVPLDIDLPLWQMWFVEGLSGGRVGLVEKLHHSLADGLGGVELATLLLDPGRRPRHLASAPTPWHPEPVPGAMSLAARDLSVATARLVRAGRLAARSMLAPVRTTRSGLRLVDGLSSVLPPGLLAPRSSVNTRIGQARRVGFVRVAMEHLQAVERAHGVTINDVVLAAVTGGLRRLLVSRGEHLTGLELQVLVPVGVPHDDGHALGNDVSAMLVRLPVWCADPGERLALVAASAERAKRHGQAAAYRVLIDALDALPQPLLAGVAGVMQHQPVVNLVVTNVRGPASPLYAHGARMLEVYPIVPLAGNLSLGVAALSYDGHMHLGLYADRDACPDVGVFAQGVRRSFAELIGPLDTGRRSAARHEARPLEATAAPRPTRTPRGPRPARAVGEE